MRIQRYDDLLKPVWDNFIRRSKNGTFLHLRDYMDYHRDRFLDYSLLVWDDKNNLLAVVPANRKGDVLESHGGLTFGGFITDAAMKVPKMLYAFHAALSYLQNESFTRVLYKTVPYIYHQLPADEDRYPLFLCNAKFVRRGLLAVVDCRQRLPLQERRRRAIEKAKKNNLSARLSEDFESYWELLTAVLAQSYSTHPVHSLSEIQLLHSRFPNHIKLYCCYEGAVRVAGVVIYQSDRVARAQYIAASERGREVGGLDFLFHYLLGEVYQQKPYFDFGTSDEHDGMYLNRGLIDQKEGFGARAVVHDHYELQLATLDIDRLTRVMEDRLVP
jgi:hypothetical protein